MGEWDREVAWLEEGRQRCAVATALYKPLTQSQIQETSRQSAPRIQLRDIWFVLRQFEENQLATCLTPALPTGKLFFLTEKGRAVLAAGFKKAVQPLPLGIDWHSYAQVARARVRKLVLEEVARSRAGKDHGKTASEIWKGVKAYRPVAVNPVFRALRDLTKFRLISSVASPKSPRSKRYALTPMGRRIVAELKR